MKARYESGMTFRTFLERVSAQRDFWFGVSKRATVPDELVARAQSYAGPWHLLVLLEDWCGDAVNVVPHLAQFVDRVPGWDLRILRRDEHLDLMDAHLTGTSRSIPVVIVLDEQYREVGWWGPRPSALQRWVTTEGRILAKSDRYLEIRRWYARDGGRTTLEEILRVVEDAATSRPLEASVHEPTRAFYNVVPLAEAGC